MLRNKSWETAWLAACHIPQWSYNITADILLGGASQFLPEVRKTLLKVAPRDLKSITLSSCHSLNDVEFLGDLTGVEELFLWKSPIQRGLAALSRLRKLRKLYLTWSGSAEELQALGKLTALEEFLASDTANLDLAFVGNLNQLRDLTIFECRRVSHAEALSNCPKLQRIAIQWEDDAMDLSWMKHLPALQKLDLWTSSEFRSLEALSLEKPVNHLLVNSAPNLVDLTMSGGLRHLRKLELSECPTLQDLSPLAELMDLESLELTYCPEITSLAPLLQCPKLQVIIARLCPKLKNVPRELEKKMNIRR
jgi:internalin A